MSEFEEKSQVQNFAKIFDGGYSDVTPEEPSPSLWASIESELEAEERNANNRPVVSLAEHRKKKSFGLAKAGLLIGSAAACICVVLFGWSMLQSSGSSVELVALGENTAASATASLEKNDSRLAVEVSNLEQVSGSSYEVWLLQVASDDPEEILDMMSLGVVKDQEAFDLPENIDPTVFSVVDISLEPNDGNLTHSGNSILRGSLVE